jgi:hypothetical protein
MKSPYSTTYAEARAKRVLVTTSATHGVEGFFGSATQVEWLRTGFLII